MTSICEAALYLRNGPAVNFLKECGSGRGCGDGVDAPTEAGPEQQLFVFFVELENLENTAADFFHQGARFAAGFLAGVTGAQRSQGFVQLSEQRALAFDQRGVGGTAVLFELTIFLERELVKFVTDELMFLESFLSAH